MELLRNELNELYAKHGLNKVTLVLSQQLDILVAEQQRKLLE